MFDLARRIGIQCGIEKCCAYAELCHRRDLVLHQRDQRRNDNAGTVSHQRRNLIAQRLAAAGWHQYQRVAAGGNVLDDLSLRIAKIAMTENVAQNGDRVRFLGDRFR